MTHDPSSLGPAAAATEAERRERAIRRIKAKNDFKIHLFIYVVVNALLVAVWFASGSTTFFWPIFPLVGWGLGLVIHGYTVYFADSYTEEQIQREMKNLR